MNLLRQGAAFVEHAQGFLLAAEAEQKTRPDIKRPPRRTVQVGPPSVAGMGLVGVRIPSGDFGRPLACPLLLGWPVRQLSEPPPYLSSSLPRPGGEPVASGGVWRHRRVRLRYRRAQRTNGRTTHGARPR
jgi:hypothetical protein